MTSLSEEREALDAREKDMRAMVEKAEMKRSWFNAFREWVETVATFLDEKYPILEKLEEEHVSLLREKYEMLGERRAQDDEDDLAMFLGSPPAPLKAEEEELDELGRVVPQQNPAVARRERRTQRAARHARHVSRRQAQAQDASLPEEDEGLSTDASLPPSDASDYQLALAQHTERVRGVLSDVRAEEFREPRKGIARWFGEWRENYSEEYTGAFGGLGLVSAWEFWVRLEIVAWDPMEVSRTISYLGLFVTKFA
jgi:GC-rich sequence DNA-binding factor